MSFIKYLLTSFNSGLESSSYKSSQNDFPGRLVDKYHLIHDIDTEDSLISEKTRIVSSDEAKYCIQCLVSGVNTLESMKCLLCVSDLNVFVNNVLFKETVVAYVSNPMLLDEESYRLLLLILLNLAQMMKEMSFEYLFADIIDYLMVPPVPVEFECVSVIFEILIFLSTTNEAARDMIIEKGVSDFMIRYVSDSFMVQIIKLSRNLLAFPAESDPKKYLFIIPFIEHSLQSSDERIQVLGLKSLALYLLNTKNIESVAKYSLHQTLARAFLHHSFSHCYLIFEIANILSQHSYGTVFIKRCSLSRAENIIRFNDSYDLSSMLFFYAKMCDSFADLLYESGLINTLIIRHPTGTFQNRQSASILICHCILHCSSMNKDLISRNGGLSVLLSQIDTIDSANMLLFIEVFTQLVELNPNLYYNLVFSDDQLSNAIENHTDPAILSLFTQLKNMNY